jgi:hypothetical protein
MSNDDQFVSHLKALETVPPASTIEPGSVLAAGRRRRVARGAGIAALTLVAVSGLSAGVAAVAHPSGPVAPAGTTWFTNSPSQPVCGSAEALTARYPGDTPPPLPEGFDAVAVVWCREPSGGHVLGTVDGPPPVMEQVTITKGIDEVTAALAEESEPPASGYLCGAVYIEAPMIFLVDGTGRSVRAHWPVDGCGWPNPSIPMDRLTPDSVVEVTVH